MEDEGGAWGELRVVIVEDDHDLRWLVRRSIEHHPRMALVGEAASGAAALDVCRSTKPDVVILDLGLPDIAGREVLSRLRADVPSVRVVIYTAGHTSSTDASAWGAAGLVAKGEQMERLMTTVEAVGFDHQSAAIELEHDLASPGAARRFASQMLTEWGSRARLDDALVIVSELVSNAVSHAASDCRLSLDLRPGVLRIEVADTGGGSPEPQPLSLTREHGRGLLIVSQMAEAWGIDPRDGAGKRVWAELPA